MSQLKRITDKINFYLRKYFINPENRKKLTNLNPTIIASNCNGGFIAHDLNLRFNSPFVNLYLTAKDFIRYLKNIEFYQQQQLTFIQTDKHYPVGKLADIDIHFMHYHSEQEAVEKWQQRTKRMNLDNLFILMTDRDGCEYQDLIEFDQLPFKNKVVFTHKAYPEIKSTVEISGFENNKMVGDLFEYTGLNGKRYYDQFDYVAWLNKQSN
ncbi:hypothetical protein A1D29_07835 [Pasteurellaceae bacterium Orientalotternb1]|nr:hypothetical protein A1D29_07835 [Pasteurellaceae bacterium Orientalotternb1]